LKFTERKFISIKTGHRSVRAVIWSLVMILFWGCSTKESRDVIAFVNNVPVFRSDLELEMKLQPLAVFDEDLIENLRNEVFEELIDQELLAQAALKQQIRLSKEEIENQLMLAKAGTPEQEFKESLKVRNIKLEDWEKRFLKQALINEFVRQKIRSQINVRRQEINNYYWEHLLEFRRRQQVRLRQIFNIKAESIQAAHKELQLGEAFGEVVSRYSQGPEISKGGDLGWVDSRQLSKSLADVAFSLRKGRFSNPVKSPYGWHIVIVDDIVPAGNMPLEEAAPEIHALLLKEKEQKLYQTLLLELKSNADIRLVDN
jgi:peptidyl-prolyl cis-trans isomerase C